MVDTGNHPCIDCCLFFYGWRLEYQLSSGAVRNHNPEIMEKAFEIVGYGKDVIEEKFSALYNAFQFGAPPHAGIAPGVDRMIMLLTGADTIRDVIAFPMNSKAQDLMMGAPGNVTAEQLQDVHIKLDLPKDSFSNRISKD